MNNHFRNEITIIEQINCHLPREGMWTTLWIARGNTGEDPEGPYPEENSNAVRLAGPLERDCAIQRAMEMRTVLEFLGFLVHEEVVSDD